ncbi:AsmA-like C-terminal domain-containing protein [bacterium]|nr:AsmA-like C-terminal domain-containing protein [bacterium]
MTDKIIINAISKTYFIIVSFISFIFLILLSLFIILQNGFYVEEISISNVTAKQLYIKWNEKLDVSLKELNITEDKNSKTSPNYEKIHGYFSKIPLFNDTFEKIVISNIKFDSFSGSFSYISGQNGFLKLSSETFLLNSSFDFESNALNIEIQKLYDSKKKIEMSGNIVVDLSKLEINAKSHFNINNEIYATVFINADNKQLQYSVVSDKKIERTTHLIDLLQPPKEVRYWILDAIKMRGATLHEARGWFEYDKIENAYKNLYAKATLDKLQYTYNPELESVQSEKTILEFTDGILYIKPQKAISYSQSLGTSWLKIDFTQKDELLTLHLLFDGVANSDILKILNTYKIKLPFVQNSGFVSTNLMIEVDLRNLNTKTKGDFYAKKANFDYLGLNIDISDAYVFLQNYDVNITNMKADYKTVATANVTMQYDANQSVGDINFKFNKIQFEDELLLDKKTALNAKYHISPEGDIITVGNSLWNYKHNRIKIDSIYLPFDLASLNVNLPATQISVENIASMYVHGPIDLKNKKVNLGVDLLSLSYKELKLAQSSAQMRLEYDTNISLSSNDKILLAFKNSDLTLDGFNLLFDTNGVKIKNASIDFNDAIEVNLNGNYLSQDSNYVLFVDNINFKNETMKNLLCIDEKLRLKLKIDENNAVSINAEELDTTFSLDDEKWVLTINSIENIKRYSKILQKYKIIDANATISKKAADDEIIFDSNITQPYTFLVENDIPTQNYFLTGTMNTKSEKIKLNINKNIDVFIGNRIKIKAKDSGINLDAIVDFMDNNDTSEPNKMNLVLNASNSYLYLSEHRRIVSDSIDLQYLNNITTAQLKHENGNAGFKLSEETFHLYGNGFGSTFMENLFALSKFKDGSLDFSMSGTTKEYNGIFYVKDTTIIEYKILNNVLAFINTIPSLVTFSLPSYNTNGLYTKGAYMSFKAKDDIFYINDLYLDSEEVDILGRGVASIKQNNIDLKLNLKTDLGSSLSQIPIVGYLLFDEDSVSTSLKVTGKLSDPEVDSLLPSEIIVAPLNLIKRTLMLPQHLLQNSEQNTTQTQEE